MNFNIKSKGIAAVLATAILGSCSSDYLQVDPTTVVSSGTIETTQEGAQAAVYGLCAAMYSIYTDYNNNLQPNGEGSLQMYYGDVMGQDYYSYFWSYRTPFVMQMNRFRDNSTWMTTYPWAYCYNLVAQANTILKGIDTIDGDRERLDFIKAQALTIRAHAYVRLLQIYGPRWTDSRNGEAMTVVLRTEPGTQEMGLSSMNDVLELIYTDLNTAIGIFDTAVANGIQRKFIWEPDEDVARGVLSRAALLKNDYATAEKAAHDARGRNGERYPIMSAEEYKGGFAEANAEWMWSNSNEMELCGYWSNGAYYACNGAYVDWNNGVGAINYELYRQIPEGDIRADLFFTPDKLTGNGLSKSAFWNEGIVDPATMDLSKNINMANQYIAFGNKALPLKNGYSKPYVSTQAGNAQCHVFFGSQYKFWAIDAYGSCSFPFMRGAEMLLNEAEAACHNNHEDVAKALLLELNAKRNPNYTCNKSGDALLAEVKLQRRIELWGEGFNFFDLKRWGEPLVRNTWKKNDMNSNNIPVAFGLTLQPNEMGGWRWMIPLSETQYNSKINIADIQ